MAFLALGHMVDSYDEFRTVPVKWYALPASQYRWPSFLQDDAFAGTPYVMQIPGQEGGSACSLLFSDEVTELWLHISCKGSDTTYSGDQEYTQRLWTLKSSNNTPVIWLEENSATHVLKLCTASKKVPFSIPTSSVCVVDLKVAYNDFRLYVNGVQQSIEPLLFTTPLAKLVFGDDTNKQGIKWFYEYVLVADVPLFGYTVKTVLPMLFSDSVDEGAHGTHVAFAEVFATPTLDGDVFMPDDTDQTFEFEPQTARGDITGVQFNAVMYQGTNKSMQLIKSVYTNVEALTPSISMGGSSKKVDMIHHIMPAGTRIDIPTDNYGVRVRKIP